MFKKLKAGIIDMAKNAVKSIQEERESKYGLIKEITKDVVNGLNYDGNKNLRKVAVVMIGAGLTVAVLSYMK